MTAVGTGFVKFPRTPHLAWLGESPPRGDKLMSAAEAARWLRRPMSVEEKVDGANLGLSVETGRLRAQSRGHYLGPRTGGQWKPLWRWLAQREDLLLTHLTSSMIAFGEWCFAKHSVFYDALPDWFLLFDVYDRSQGRFWSRARRDDWARAVGLSSVPQLATGVFGLQAVRAFLIRSHFGEMPAEGIYLRWDDGDWLRTRAKVVRPGWVLVGDDHWSSGRLRTNQLRDVGGDAGSAPRR